MKNYIDTQNPLSPERIKDAFDWISRIAPMYKSATALEVEKGDSQTAARMTLMEKNYETVQAVLEIFLKSKAETFFSLASFLKWALENASWVGADLCGGDIQDKAEKLGLIKRVPYDPDKHGEDALDMIEPGDDYFELSESLLAFQETKK